MHALEFVFLLLVRRIDEHETAPFGGGHQPAQREVSVFAAHADVAMILEGALESPPLSGLELEQDRAIGRAK